MAYDREISHIYEIVCGKCCQNMLQPQYGDMDEGGMVDVENIHIKLELIKVFNLIILFFSLTLSSNFSYSFSRHAVVIFLYFFSNNNNFFVYDKIYRKV